MGKQRDSLQDLNLGQCVLLGIDEISDPNTKIDVLRKRVIQQQIVIRKLRQEIAELKGSPRIDKETLEFFSQNSTRDKFYSSKEWRSIRFEALLNQKFCKLCGSEENLHVDHIIPRYLRPDLALKLTNLQILCKECNLGKGTRTVKIRKNGAGNSFTNKAPVETISNRASHS